MCKLIKKIFLYFFVFVVFSFFVWIAYLVLGGRDPVILMYHSVGESLEKESILNVSEEVFSKQMAFLRQGGYHVISLLELAQMIEDHKRIPFKTVVITFDDGYENNYTIAYPILKKYQFPATIFMVVDYIGQSRQIRGHEYRFLDKKMLLEMAREGLMAIGAHTRSHPYLPDIKDGHMLDEEVVASKKDLEAILKEPVNTFAYPVGGYSAEVIQCVRKAGYHVAVTTLPLKKDLNRFNLFALKRIKMTEKVDNPFVFFIETSGYYVRMKEMSR
ncbi:MAG: polysaccharide deacetylase family protein [Candidatus Omnitrophota bacterium]